MTLAAELILASQENRNPYDFAYHLEDCCEEVWADRGAGLLASAEEIAERECDACAEEWKLWGRIIEDVEDPVWGEIAYAAFELDHYLGAFRPPPSEISVEEWEYVKAVRLERNRRQNYTTWKAGQKPATS